MTDPDERFLSGDEMRKEERWFLQYQRTDGQDPDDYLGLAFSGGGIRSATFNLGILQALAKHDLLRYFDYLSTVSGGGYIGAWLSALIYRNKGLANATRMLASAQGSADEPPPLRFLRRYSNYLTPKTGLSGDTLAAVATYLRNFGLNLIPLISLASFLIIGMYLMTNMTSGFDLKASDNLELYGALVLIFLAVGCAAAGLATASISSYDGVSPEQPCPPNKRQGETFCSKDRSDPAQFTAARPFWAGLTLLLTTVAAILIALAMLSEATYRWFPRIVEAIPFLDSKRYDWIIAGGIAYLAAWIFGYFIWAWNGNRHLVNKRLTQLPLFIILTVLCGAAGGFLLFGVQNLLHTISQLFPGPVITTTGSSSYVDVWIALCIGTPLVLLAFSTVVALHIGLLGQMLSREAREWWSRIGGFLLLLALAWCLAFALSGLAPAMLIWVKGWIVEIGGVWAALTGVGVWLAKSPLTGGDKNRAWLEFAVRATPYVFLVGVATGLSGVVYSVFSANSCSACLMVQPVETIHFVPECSACEETRTVARDFIAIAHDVFSNMGFFDTPHLVGAAVGCFIVFMLATWRIDINLFSLNQFYCGRLVRTFLGASNFPERKKHPFTGFCADDDLRLAKLRDQRPFHIINTALNLSGGDELAWQTRRATSFTFTPLHCGYEYLTTRSTKENGQTPDLRGGYRPTIRYQNTWGAFLGMAISISGAAASPLCGFHTSAPLAALMTIFNVRLGQWIGNPAKPNAWKTSSPRFGSYYLLKEMTATANTEADYLYLSDGGHFENLGIYELVRRGCRLIVATDAGCDPDYAFDDLANAIRKCSVDLGATIDIDIRALRPIDDFRHTATHYAAGRIHYADGTEGLLLYVKASLTGNEGPDILNYATNHKSFPHETTADQSFDEEQFESYRALGEHIGNRLFASIRQAAEATHGSFSSSAFAAQVATMATAPVVDTQNE